jgi:hypothetical protein
VSIAGGAGPASTAEQQLEASRHFDADEVPGLAAAVRKARQPQAPRLDWRYQLYPSVR